MLKITSTFKPECNEVWIKNNQEAKSKFWLVQPVQQGVRYYIKHSGDFLYKVSNEEDRQSFRVTKIRMPDQIKPSVGQITERVADNSEVTVAKKQSRIVGSRHELQPTSNYLGQRENQLVPLHKTDEVTGLQSAETIYTPEQGEIVQGIEVFQHYMAVLVEKSK